MSLSLYSLDIGDGSNYNGQTTGVIGGGQFRPAQQSYYDSSKWAMTLVGSASTPDPPERRKDGAEPTALKPLTGDDGLPHFITILAQLPLIRKVVFAGPSRLDYAIPGSSWWDGPAPGVEDQAEDLIDVSDDESDDLDFIAEVQRLVAFLALSIRTYGPVEHLTKLKQMQVPAEEPLASLKRFMEGFDAAFTRFQPDLPLTRLFRAAVVKEEDEQTIPFYTLEINLDDLDEAPEDLYDALDMVFWAAGDADFEVASLCEVPQVLTVGLSRRDPRTDGVGIRVPADLYVGRYLTANQESVRRVRDAITQSRAEVAGFERERRALLEFRKPDGTFVPDMLKVFENVLSAAPNRSNVAKELPHIESLKDQSMFDEVETKYLELKAKVDGTPDDGIWTGAGLIRLQRWRRRSKPSFPQWRNISIGSRRRRARRYPQRTSDTAYGESSLIGAPLMWPWTVGRRLMKMRWKRTTTRNRHQRPLNSSGGRSTLASVTPCLAAYVWSLPWGWIDADLI